MKFINVLKKYGEQAVNFVKSVWQEVKPMAATACKVAVVAGGLLFSGVSRVSAAIMPNMGTLNSGGADVTEFAGDATTMLEFCAQAGIALTIVSVVIAVGWKAYRFFRPAR